jgi:hypothetical protein
VVWACHQRKQAQSIETKVDLLGSPTHALRILVKKSMELYTAESASVSQALFNPIGRISARIVPEEGMLTAESASVSQALCKSSTLIEAYGSERKDVIRRECFNHSNLYRISYAHIRAYGLQRRRFDR